jgi:hypothetical protein
MPKEKGDKMAVTIWIDKKIGEKAGELAEKAGITRSKFLANVIEVGVEEISKADKIGLWAFARVLRDFRERFKKSVRESVEQERSEIRELE